MSQQEQEISRENRKCISQCILEHWSEESQTPLERRDDEYARCLSACHVCS